MAEKFLLEIITPKGLIFSGEVEETTAPGEKGEFGVLKGHTPFITSLNIGKVSYKAGGAYKHLAVAGGYAEVGPEKTNILVDTAVTAEGIDLESVRIELKKAEEALAGMTSEDPNLRKIEDSCEFARVKIKLVQGEKP